MSDIRNTDDYLAFLLSPSTGGSKREKDKRDNEIKHLTHVIKQLEEILTVVGVGFAFRSNGSVVWARIIDEKTP